MKHIINILVLGFTIITAGCSAFYTVKMPTAAPADVDREGSVAVDLRQFFQANGFEPTSVHFSFRRKGSRVVAGWRKGPEPMAIFMPFLLECREMVSPQGYEVQIYSVHHPGEARKLAERLKSYIGEHYPRVDVRIVVSPTTF